MKLHTKKAIALIEYVLLFVIIMSAFFIMRSHIQQGFFGLWAQSGKSFAYGRQYDAQKTVACDYNEQTGVWYDHNCFVNTGGSCQTDTCSQGGQ